MWKCYIDILFIFILSTSIHSLKANFNQITSKLHDIHCNQGFLLIDGDNCRGKANFQVSKQELAQYVSKWLTKSKSSCSPVLYFDHGQQQSAYYFHHGPYDQHLIASEPILHSNNDNDPGLSPTSFDAVDMMKNLVVSFSGVSHTVDDCIVKDLLFIQNILRKDVCIITDDQDLRSRCRKHSMSSSYSSRSRKKQQKHTQSIAAMRIGNDERIDDNTMKSMATIESKGFIEYLYAFHGMNIELTKHPPKYLQISTSVVDVNTIDDNGCPSNDQLAYIRRELMRQQVEMQLNLQILEETLATTTSRRIKSKLTLSSDALRNKLVALVSAYQRTDQWEVEDSHKNNYTTSSSIEGYDVYEQGARLFQRLAVSGRAVNPASVNGAEETWERVILAEKCRQELLTLSLSQSSTSTPMIAVTISSSQDDINVEVTSMMDSSVPEAKVIDTITSDDISTRRTKDLNAYIEHVQRDARLHPSRKKPSSPSSASQHRQMTKTSSTRRIAREVQHVDDILSIGII